MDDKIPHSLLKIKPKLPGFKQRRFLIFFIFFALFLSSKEQFEISLIIQGKGSQHFINESFYLDPSEVLVNGKPKNLLIKLSI